jgi:hypothetical protein
MEFRIRGMSYGLLLSHTFPGLLLEIEVVLAFQFFTNVNLARYSSFVVDTGAAQSAVRIVALAIAMLVCATLLGIVIDGVHHWFWERRIKKEDYEIHKHIKSVEQMQIYIHFVEDDLWYYYEAYANTAIAMIPGLGLLPYWLAHCLQAHWLFVCVVFLVYAFLLMVMLVEISKTKREVNETEKSLIENFRTAQKKAHEAGK